MDSLYSVYLELLQAHFHDKNLENPIEVNKERFKVKALFVATVIFLNYKKNIISDNVVVSANQWLKTAFSKKNFFSVIIDGVDSELVSLADEKLRAVTFYDSLDMGTFYEGLIGIEIAVCKTNTNVSKAKNYRNNLGSYYTPFDLAEAVATRTLDCYFKFKYGLESLSLRPGCCEVEKLIDLVRLTRFADFSCGAGVFLIQIVNYFERIVEKNRCSLKEKKRILESIALNISAFDVDCLALEVAKLNLLSKIERPELYDQVTPNFIHANFLLHSDKSFDSSLKIDTFFSGYIYHQNLSLQKKSLRKYDVILGNPPWEKIRFEERSFYALYLNNIPKNYFKSSRRDEIIETRKGNKYLAAFSEIYKREIDEAKVSVKGNPFFAHSNAGELNTYSLFADAALQLRADKGVIGLVLKSAIITSRVNQNFFNYIVQNGEVIEVFDFINRKKIFDIDSRERFCFLLLGDSENDCFSVAMNLTTVDEIKKMPGIMQLSHDDLEDLNPITKMMPNVSSQHDVDLILRISRAFSFFKDVYTNVKFGRIVHLTSHADYIVKNATEDYLPVYEGKFFNQYDGKFSGFNGVQKELRFGSKSSSVLLDDIRKSQPDYLPESRFYIDKQKWIQLSRRHTEKYMLAWRSLTSATNTRTCVATILPFMPATQSVQFLTVCPNDILYLTGLFNSVVFDYFVKKKISGIDLTQSVINQVPVPSKKQAGKEVLFNGRKLTVEKLVSLLVYSLLYGDSRLNNLFKSIGLFNHINESRSDMVKKIDLLFMYLYDLNDSEVKIVLSEFTKQYVTQDYEWFIHALQMLRLNNTVCSSISFTASFSPIT